MQRRSTRPRSDSDEADRDRPRQRQRHSVIIDPSLTSSTTPIQSTRPTSTHLTPLSSSPSHLSDSSYLHPTSDDLVPRNTNMTSTTMGPPLPSSNGVLTSNGVSSASPAGPSTNGHSNGVGGGSSGGNPLSFPPHLIGEVATIRPIGRLMYEDDRDWSEDLHQDDVMVVDGADGEAFSPPGTFGGEGSHHHPKRHVKLNAKRMPVVREEVVRLILQGLRDIGYHQSADVLEAESGYQLSTPAAADFQAAILGGRWNEALALLSQLGIDMTNITSTSTSTSAPALEEPASSSTSLHSVKSVPPPIGSSTPTAAEQAKFLVSQQKYLEYLEVGQQKKALYTLRTELAPVAKDPDVLHTLSGYMMCLGREDLYKQAGWDGAAGSSRRRLLEHLQSFISPQVMVPQRRLATLLDQARQHQTLSCMYHQDTEPSSLYTDHECKPGLFPSVTTHILADHTDEVWRIEWSPDGTMLASAGKDRQVVIWLLETMPKQDGGLQWSVRPLHHLREHRDPVDVMAWSPDGGTLVTGADKGLYIWNTRTGLQKPTSIGASPHGDQISAIQWKPDGSEFLVSSMDCKLVFYSAGGNIVRQWSFNTLQLVDFAITPDATRLVASTTSLKRVPIENKLKPSMSARPSEQPDGGTGTGTVHVPGNVGEDLAGFGYGTMEHGLMVIRLADKEIVNWSQDLRCEITGLKLSWDAKRILISCNPDEIQMWSLEPQLRPIRQFKGHIQSRFLIRSGFGALKDRFVLSGSEDGHVYVWQSNSPHPVQVLAGHDSTVNCVAWNPIATRRVFASCSDDGTVRVWQAPDQSGVMEDVDEEFECAELVESTGMGNGETVIRDGQDDGGQAGGVGERGEEDGQRDGEAMVL